MIFTLISIHMSYGEDEKEEPKKNGKEKLNNNEQNVSIENDMNNNTITSNYEIPLSIENFINDGYLNFTKEYNTEIEKEAKEFSGKDKAGNMNCIKALLANVYYPLEFDNSDYYYNSICENDNNILKNPIQELDKIINNYPNVCNKNGINYKKAYNIIKARHFFNCIKNFEGQYCYKKDLDYGNIINDSKYYTMRKSINKNEANEDPFIKNINNLCSNWEKSKNDFCKTMLIFSNIVADKIIQDDISLEMYYVGNKTFGIKMNKMELKKQAQSCTVEKIDEIVKSAIEIKNRNNPLLDNNAKKLINLYEESGSISQFINKYTIFIIILTMIIINII